MATKAEIIAKIQGVLTLNPGVTTRAEHEEALHTDIASVLENAYPDEIRDTHSSSTVLGIYDSQSVEFDVRIVKQFRCVKMNGTIENTGTVGMDRPLEVILDEYKPADATYYFTTGFVGSEPVRMEIRRFSFGGSDPVIIRVIDNLMPGERVNFNLEYNTED